MVKCMKKAAADVHHAEASSSLGVRTRAKTLALEKSLPSLSTGESLADSESDDDCYMKLRSRILKRCSPSLLKKAKKPRSALQERDEFASQGNEEKSGTEEKQVNELEGVEKNEQVEEKEDPIADRTTRESTPDHLIMRSDNLKPPNLRYKARPTVIINTNIIFGTSNPITPSAEAIEQFLAAAQSQQEKDQRSINNFMEKYNFDPVNEKPLEGRWEWEKLEP